MVSCQALGWRFDERPDGISARPPRTFQHVDASQIDPHLVHDRGHAFIIRERRPEFWTPSRSGMADFEMAQIDFRFAPRQQSDLGSARGESRWPDAFRFRARLR